MGIKGLGKLLRDQNVDCYCDIPLNWLSGKRVAVDAYNWLYRYLPAALDRTLSPMKDITQPIDFEIVYKHMIQEFVNFNIKFCRFEINMIWIWDGAEPLLLKEQTKAKRRETRKTKSISTLAKIEALKELSILERPPNLIENIKKELKQTTFLPTKYIDRIKDFSASLGLKNFTAEYEGEKLCSALAVNRYVAAVWSTDTDILAIGCPLMINVFVDTKDEILKVKGVNSFQILEHFKFDHQTFRDFCILLGTDFNSNPYKVGPVNALKLIREHRSIEKIKENTKHEIQFPYKKIRELFTPEHISIDETTLRIDQELLECFDESLEDKLGIRNLCRLISMMRGLTNCKSVVKCLSDDSEDDSDNEVNN